jgi:hypothetical protein
MENGLENNHPVVRLRAFRAIDDPDACRLFLEGHAAVLTSIGITKVTSSKNDWVNNPAVFVIVVESLDGKVVFGGARVHAYGGTQPLPIEEATGSLDPSIFSLVKRFAEEGTGEICGLWNSQEFSGYGIGSPLLIRTGIAITSQIGLKTLFALCAPYTVKPVVNCGMELEDSIGNKGTFYYPKLDLLATTMVLRDVDTLSKAQEQDRDAVLGIRNNLNIQKHEVLKEKDIIIHYSLEIPHLDRWDFKEVIASATHQYPGPKKDEKDLDFF